MNTVRSSSKQPQIQTQQQQQEQISSQQGRAKDPHRTRHAPSPGAAEAETYGNGPAPKASNSRPVTNTQQQQQQQQTPPSARKSLFSPVGTPVSRVPQTRQPPPSQYQAGYANFENNTEGDFESESDYDDADAFEDADSLGFDADEENLGFDSGDEDDEDHGGGLGGFGSGFGTGELLQTSHRAALARMAARNNAAFGRRWRQPDIREYMLKRAKLESGRKRKGNLPPDDALPRPHTFPKLPRTLQTNICE